MAGELSTRYWGSFFLCALVCVLVQFRARSNSTTSSTVTTTKSTVSTAFSAFQFNYLAVFLLAMFSDWLQGPYVYELYVSYGFSQEQIAELFVCGFGSSMIVGTFVGGLADTLGRKFMCIMYCVCYIVACFTKLVPNYWVLMLGRFLSGVSTSLLFSVFESWMVCEHFKFGFDSTMLSDTFSYATFGNGLVAVIAGLIANTAAESFGFVAPFVVAVLPLCLVAIIIITTWNENYGNQQLDYCSSLVKGFHFVKNDSRIAALGLAQSCFEGAMYTFVFMWTPALKSPEEVAQESNSGSGSGNSESETTAQYLGLIFAVYMVCVMIGSSFFKIFSTKKENIYKIPIALHGLAFLSMLAITMFLEYKVVVYGMFLLFEGTVGLFYPSYGVIKSERIPEDIRSGVMNIFRIPLNAFVVLLLLKIKHLSSEMVFSICAGTHALALVCYLYFYMNMPNSSEKVVVSVVSGEGEELLSKDSTV
jgi:MFS transporter, MFS domain-containing protein family, molybdate-anion transporter